MENDPPLTYGIFHMFRCFFFLKLPLAKNSNLNIIFENSKQNEVYPVIKKLDSSTLQIVPETENLTKNEYPVITKFCRQETSLSILSSEVNLVKFIKNLYYVQCEVDPVGILNIIPILESAKNNQLYNKNLVDFHVKVRTTNMHNQIIHECLDS